MGNAFMTVESAKPPAMESSALDELMAACVGPAYNRYQKRFQLMNSKGFRPGLAWAALPYPPVWLLYRKMYHQILIYVLASTAMIIPLPFYDTVFALFVIHIIYCLSGHWLYWRSVKRRIQRALRHFPETGEARGFLKGSGGTHPLLAALLAAATAARVLMSLAA
ncbi:hypothetical protein C4J81_04780 [Deltaproteobacteria bacterium Smac51]|nr:hypothetical protein C4J81_04780 [Deltaproteobacteria bacterium Smac51]